MILRALVLAVGASALIAPVGPAAHAATAIVDQTDPSGDVNIFDGGGSKPTDAQRRTIDLQRFTVSAQGDGLRLTFRIARIAAGRTFDQVVEAQFREAGQRDSVLDVQAVPQHKNGTAYYSDDTICLADVTTARRTGTVRVDVPAGCVPTGQGVLRVTTYLQKKNGSGPGYSEDTMRVKGLVEL